MARVDVPDPPFRTRGATQPPARRLLLVFLMCVLLGGVGGLLVATAGDPAPARARFLPPRETAYDFHLRDQNGRDTSLADARGKVVALTFVYTSCRDLCPAEGYDIGEAMEQIGGRGVVAYVVSVDPIGDTPKRAGQWLERRELPADRSHYLVGSRAELRPVWQAYGIVPLVASRAEAEAALQGSEAFWKENPYRPDAPHRPYETPPPRPAPREARQAYPDTDDMEYRGRARHVAGWDFEHSAYVLLIDKRGEQRIGIPFEQLSPASLARDMRILLAEP